MLNPAKGECVTVRNGKYSSIPSFIAMDEWDYRGAERLYNPTSFIVMKVCSDGEAGTSSDADVRKSGVLGLDP